MAQAPSSASAGSLSSGAGSALGALGAVGALGYLLSSGPSPLPSQFTTVEGYAPGEVATGKQLVNTGSSLTALGEAGIADAQAGKLTPEQQAVLAQTRNTEENKARQMFAGMGRSPDKDTSFLNTSEGIDAKLLAAAQSFISTNIQLAVGTLSAGATFTGEGLQFEQAAASNMIAAGNAQIQLDKDYSDAVTSAFEALGKAFGAAAPMMAASDARLKRESVRIGHLANGIGVYLFRYMWEKFFRYGVVAQDVVRFRPEAVHDLGGYLVVDYANLGDMRIHDDG